MQCPEAQKQTHNRLMTNLYFDTALCNFFLCRCMFSYSSSCMDRAGPRCARVCSRHVVFSTAVGNTGLNSNSTANPTQQPLEVDRRETDKGAVSAHFHCSQAVLNHQQNIVEKHCDGSGTVQHSEKQKWPSRNGRFFNVVGFFCGASASVRIEA